MISTKGNQSTGKTLRTRPKVTVVIPCLNDGKTLGPILKSIKRLVDEVIVVDDGSKDGIVNLVKSSNCILIRHKSTLGYDKSINDGFRLAVKRGSAIVLTFDADGEHKVSDVKRVIKPILNGEADVVVGVRPTKRHLDQKIFAFFTRVLYGISDPLSGFKAYHVKVYKSVGFFDRVGSIGTQLAVKAVQKGYKVKNVAIRARKRADKSRFYYNYFLGNLKVYRSLLYMLLGKF